MYSLRVDTVHGRVICGNCNSKHFEVKINSVLSGVRITRQKLRIKIIATAYIRGYSSAFSCVLSKILFYNIISIKILETMF